MLVLNIYFSSLNKFLFKIYWYLEYINIKDIGNLEGKN